MDRRTYTFVVASAAFLFFYLSLRAVVAPPQPELDPKADQVAEVAQDDVDVEPAPDQSPPTSEEILGTKDDEVGDEGVATTSGATKWYTLGSMNPASKHNLLITFCSQGGAIERIELTTRNGQGAFAYRRVDTKTGYLGYFAGQPSAQLDGVVVNVVGPGTPASLALAKTGEKGIQVGDVIVAIGEKAVTSVEDIQAGLEMTKPGDTVTVEVSRGGQAASSRLLFQATLSEHPLDLIRLAKYGGEDQIAGNLSRLSCLVTLAQVGAKEIVTGKRSIKSIGDPEFQNWTTSLDSNDDGSETIRFETTIGSKAMTPLGAQPVRMNRSYTLRPDSYVVDMDIQVANLGQQAQDLAIRLEGPNGVTPEGWWYSNKISPNFSGAAARDVVYRTTAEGHVLVSGMTLLKEARSDPKEPNYGIFATDSSEAARDLKYIGVDAQYFAVAYMPPQDETSMGAFSRASATIVANESNVAKHKEKAINSSFFLNGKTIQVPSEQSFQKSLRMYAGPKEPAILDEQGIGDFVYYGWFSFFSNLLSGLLHILQSIVGNYAVAIILLTVIVRGVMFPLSRNAAVNAQRMQELAPEMKKIAEKYKDDMEGRLKAQQALQKRVGFNPLAGCLPMFLQLPIFMGLYRALSVDIDLRQKPIWDPNGWASNLAAPDQFLYWADTMPDMIGGRGTGWLGPYLNILPIFVVVLFITQQKLFMPPATDEQTAMTQKVMTFMTLFMGLFFFRVPAGLCIYFIASSMWGIGERLLVKKTLPKGKHFDLNSDADVIDAVASKKKKGDGKKSITERLLDQVNQKEPEQPAERPGKRKRPPNKKKK